MSSIEELKGAITSGVARADRYKIMLPSDFGMDGRDLNILCRAANLPGRQILTQERRIGMITQKMPYAFAFNDVSLTFNTCYIQYASTIPTFLPLATSFAMVAPQPNSTSSGCDPMARIFNFICLI